MITHNECQEFWLATKNRNYKEDKSEDKQVLKYPKEEIQKMLAQYGDDTIIRYYIHRVEKRITRYNPAKIDSLKTEFATLEKELANKSVEKRIALLPYGSEEYINKLEKDVLTKGTLVERYNYALKSPKRDHIKELEDSVYDSGDINIIEMFACHVKDADINRAEDYILEHGNDDNKINFLVETDCNKQRVYDSIEYNIRLAQYTYKYTRKDNSKMYDTLIKLGKQDLVETYFKGHENEDISVLEPFAKTDRQKAFYAKLAQRAELER